MKVKHLIRLLEHKPKDLDVYRQHYRTDIHGKRKIFMSSLTESEIAVMKNGNTHYLAIGYTLDGIAEADGSEIKNIDHSDTTPEENAPETVYTLMSLSRPIDPANIDASILLTTRNRTKAVITLLRTIKDYIDSWYGEDEPRTKEEYFRDFWEVPGTHWLFCEDTWYAEFKIVETILS